MHRLWRVLLGTAYASPVVAALLVGALKPDSADALCGTQRSWSTVVSGVGLVHQLTAFEDPCSANRVVDYRYDVSSTVAIDQHYVSLSRAWRCGSQFFDFSGVSFLNSAGSYWSSSPPQSASTCALQADLYSKWYDSSFPGTGDVWHYINF